MTNNTTLQFADNGIIIRYDDGVVEVKENDLNPDNTFISQPDLTDKQKVVGLQYGGIIANTLNCFDADTLDKAIGFRVLLNIVPLFH